MKQHLRFLFLLATLISMVTINVHAYDAEIDGIYYNFNGDEAQVTSKKLPSTYTGEVVIPESVTYEGKTYSVTSIGEAAFYACSDDFVSVDISNKVTSIGKSAFYYCNGLTSITVPNSVKTIQDQAFQNCRNLKTVTMGNAVEYIGSSCFVRCESLESINIPSSLTTISTYSFYGNKLKSIVIPMGVTTIESHAFGSNVLESVTIPSSVTSIGESAFDRNWNGMGWNNQNPIKIYISDLEAWLKIPFGRFDKTHIHLSSFVFNGSEKSYCLFLNGEELKDIVIPESLTKVPVCAFYGNKGLRTITLHNGVTEIEAAAFSNCGNLESVVIPNSVTTIGYQAFYEDTIQSLTIGTGVLNFGNDVFRSSSYSDYVSNIKKTIWLTNTPPENYQQAAGVINYVSNDQFKFSNPYSATVVYPQLSSMFTRDGIKYVVIDIPSLTCDAIDCVYDESAELTKLGTTVAYNANRTFKVLNVMPYTCCGNTFIKNVELTDLPYIDDHVFDGCTNLQSVKLPETVKGLGISSFQDCASLTEIAIPAATTLVMYNAFKGCTSLQNVIMNDGTEPLTLAYNDDRLKINYKTNKVELYNGTPLFEDCPLDYVYIGRNISYSAKEQAGYSPFYRNTSLRTVEITDQETEIGENEFYGCSGLKNVKIGNGVTTIGNWAFSGCSSLDYFEFGSSMQTIGTEAFSDCSNVTRIISHATTPPVCGSQALDDIQKTDFGDHPGCELYVPQGSMGAYFDADQWKQFWLNMYEYDPTAVHGITTTTDAPAVYSLSGQRLAAPRKGINIIGGKKILMR
jgi:hypothetical protein